MMGKVFLPKGYRTPRLFCCPQCFFLVLFFVGTSDLLRNILHTVYISTVHLLFIMPEAATEEVL